ncbi:hypothetical protein J6590_099251 [Homalodisca vitripennis]|nr:hypothetical protein J6590_099251 [Homalodisca vitripennis]
MSIGRLLKSSPFPLPSLACWLSCSTIKEHPYGNMDSNLRIQQPCNKHRREGEDSRVFIPGLYRTITDTRHVSIKSVVVHQISFFDERYQLFSTTRNSPFSYITFLPLFTKNSSGTGSQRNGRTTRYFKVQKDSSSEANEAVVTTNKEE